MCKSMVFFLPYFFSHRLEEIGNLGNLLFIMERDSYLQAVKDVVFSRA